MTHPDRRPDPETLLAQVHEEERRASRGRLKIFFGAAPGVGKTFAMLEAARARAAEGVDPYSFYWSIGPAARSKSRRSPAFAGAQLCRVTVASSSPR